MTLKDDDQNWIFINKRYALYDFRIGKCSCRYIIDLSKPGSGWVDRISDGQMRWIPKEYRYCNSDNCVFLKGYGFIIITKDQFFDNLMANYPDVLEFLLFHPELL